VQGVTNSATDPDRATTTPWRIAVTASPTMLTSRARGRSCRPRGPRRPVGDVVRMASDQLRDRLAAARPLGPHLYGRGGDSLHPASGAAARAGARAGRLREGMVWEMAHGIGAPSLSRHPSSTELGTSSPRREDQLKIAAKSAAHDRTNSNHLHGPRGSLVRVEPNVHQTARDCVKPGASVTSESRKAVTAGGDSSRR